MSWIVFSEFSINVARGLFTLALGMMLYQSTDNLWSFAFVYASEFFIGLMAQGYAGSCVDKFGAKKILLLAALVNVMILAVPVLAGVEGNAQLIMFVAFALNMIRPFLRAAIFALIPMLGSDAKLEKINAYTSMALQCGQVIGMVLASVLLEFTSPFWVLFTVFSGYVLALVFYFLTVLAIQVTKEAEHSSKPASGSWQEVTAYLKENKNRLFIFVFPSIDYASLALFNLLLAPAVKHNFDDLARWLSFIDGAFAFGAIVGGLIASRLKLNDKNRFEVSLLLLVVCAMIFIGYSMKASGWFILPVTFVYGVLITISTVAWIAAQQRCAKDEIKGRLASVRYICNASFSAAAAFLLSYFNDFSFYTACIAASGLLVMCFVLAMLLKTDDYQRIFLKSTRINGVKI
ncbi:MFS transporter [Vibrio sagamiensis]|uniref:MFS transporter n=1 Tax=Vibrio sagamiensis NBRC 104589 TaxID=1219064 RepID=A0A511QGC4_9VIBR|nr:MFS transporter [Vibrio sagamiensis]PNQ56214.1 MFS transporter [Vibrio agarivorans]GEM76247.1 hypothetical protein VSA01S_23590 [Vibrio sagamiensis NBRC 104589]